MASRTTAIDLPLTFPGADAALRRDLERLAAGLDRYLKDASIVFVPRWANGAINPTSAQFGVAVVINLTSTQEHDFTLPRPNVADGGRELLIIRQTATGVARAHPVGCTVDAEDVYQLPNAPGAYRLFFDGTNFWSYRQGADAGVP
jgi:hypothetical protein